MSPHAARQLAGLLEARTGQQLQTARLWRLDMALQPLIRETGCRTADQLVGRIVAGGDDALAERVIGSLLNHETSFYRDQASFALFESKGLARLRRDRAAQRSLRLWCAGCSTGQEVYSIAMMFAAEPERWAGWRIEILGTDVSAGTIAQAEQGRYSQFEIQRGLPVARMLRWFEKEGDGWRAVPALRHMVRFRTHSLLDEAPAPGRFDAIFCRNVLLYFATPVRRQVFDRLSTAIAPDGLLMLGAGETVLGNSEAFVSDFECRGLYRPIAGDGVAAA